MRQHFLSGYFGSDDMQLGWQAHPCGIKERLHVGAGLEHGFEAPRPPLRLRHFEGLQVMDDPA